MNISDNSSDAESFLLRCDEEEEQWGGGDGGGGERGEEEQGGGEREEGGGGGGEGGRQVPHMSLACWSSPVLPHTSDGLVTQRECLGYAHPSQSDPKKKTHWSQNVIFFSIHKICYCQNSLMTNQKVVIKWLVNLFYKR